MSKLYTLSWNSEHTYRVGEYDIRMPDKPPDKDIINYKLPAKKQFFKYTEIPKNLRRLPAKEREQFIKDEWHRRINGEWQFINGTFWWIPGRYWWFLNRWTPQGGGKIEFRWVQLAIAYWWEMCVRDPNCYGGFFVKPRRMGGTEQFIAEQAEYATGCRGVHIGMQNLSATDARKDFDRIMTGIRGLPYYFTPIFSGSDRPSGGEIIFDYPGERQTMKKVKAAGQFDYEEEERANTLKSRISYESTKLGKYDGDILQRFRFGEMGKQQQIVIDAIKQWDVIKPCFEDKGSKNIIGKAIVETTIEDNEDKSGNVMTMSSLKISQKFWDDSDPNKKNKNGRTKSGLYRLYINAIDAYDTDAYGFPKREEALEFYKNEFEGLKGTELIRRKRKYPITIHDAFTPDVATACLDAAVTSTRLRQIYGGLNAFDQSEENGKPYVNPSVTGNLVWKEKDKSVEWIPTPDGRWVICQHPHMANNYIQKQTGKAPGNIHLYCIGTDPIEAGEEATYGTSKAAIAVKRKLDLTVDTEPEPGKMKTNKYVCIYKHRPADPRTFYEDLIMTCFYFGAKVLGEKEKGKNCINYFYERGYGNYLAVPSAEVAVGQQSKHKVWVHASTQVITQYIDYLQSYWHNYGMNHDIVEILEEAKTFSRDTRTLHDLIVACGICELDDRRIDTYRQPNAENNIEIEGVAMRI